ncbi:MAG: 2'-5' RNA ligase [Pyrobaculum sp.]
MGCIYGVLPPIPPPPPFRGIEPVKPHITLVKIDRCTKVDIKYRAFTASVKDVAILPSKTRPRYIALLVEPKGEFAALRTLLTAAVSGYVLERYGEFKPHITLYSIRLKHPTEEEVAAAVEEVKKYMGYVFRVVSLHLLDTRGGLYTPLYTINLYG